MTPNPLMINGREMTRHQRNLVDTCFEEGQFESGIAVLDQLRSPKYNPAASHIRQLLFIALYPPPQEAPIEATDAVPLSPRKAAKQQRAPPYPSPAATAASQRLLASLAATYSPAVLFRALPCYTAEAHSLAGDEDEYSVIAREAMRITESKNCWAILAEGFIQRKKFGYFGSNDNRSTARKSRGKDPFVDDDDASDDDTPCIIAENAWPMLDWMIMIFELDEKEQEKNGLPRHSPLLLTQIPSSRSGTDPQWEVDTPLEIAFYCLKQIDRKHKSYAARLLTLLINLTATVHIDTPIFVAGVYTRLSSFTADEFAMLFSMLAPSPVVCRFKVALCQRYITYAASTLGKGDSRPKPQARAQPVPRTIRATQRPSEQSDDRSSTNPPVGSNPAASSIASKYPLPSSSEILRITEMGLGQSRDIAALLRVKFELLVAFGILQSHAVGDQKDREWSNMIRDGRMKNALSTAFGRDENGLGNIYRVTLTGIMAL